MDSFNDALVAAVKVLGGSKMVGCLLWPEKAPDAAQRLLLDCLNDDRPAHLTPDHVLMLLRLARQRGHHDALAWLLADLGYAAPVPMEPRDEAADLQRQFVEATRVMAAIASRIERLQAPPGSIHAPYGVPADRVGVAHGFGLKGVA